MSRVVEAMLPRSPFADDFVTVKDYYMSHCAPTKGRTFACIAQAFSFYLFFLPFAGAQKMPDTILLKTAVIQATRASKKSPVPHTNLTRSQIQSIYHAQDMPYLLGAVPSLVESSDAGNGIGYTGMRIRGSDPTRINVSINGIPFNDAESQGVFWVNLPDLAASAAEIQVQRGAGSSTNGPGSFGATVNIDLSAVKALPFAELSNSLGSFGARKHAVYMGTGLIGNWYFAGRLSTIHSNGYIDRAKADLNALHLQAAYIDDRHSFQAHLLTGHELTYQAWNGVPARYLADPVLRRFNAAGTEKAGEPYDNEIDNYTQRHLLLHYKRSLTQGLFLQLNGHYTRGFGYFEQYKAQQRFADYNLPDFRTPDTLIQSADLVRQRWLDNHFYGGTFALHWAPPINPPFLTAAPEFLLGGAVSRYDGQHFGEVIWAEIATAPKGWRYYDNQAVKHDANIFLKMETAYRGGLTTFLDLQFRRVDYQFLGFDNQQQQITQQISLHFFNPKAGFNWQINAPWSAYGFVGLAGREPNRDDYTQSTPQSRPRAERMVDWEAGIKGQGRSWKTGLNFFWMQYRDQLVLDGRLNDVGAYIRTNVPQSYRAGVEWEGYWRLGAGFSLIGQASLSQNKALAFTEYRDNWDTGAQDVIEHRRTNLAFSPRATARLEGVWDVFPSPGNHALSLGWSAKYVGRQFLDNTQNAAAQLPAYLFSDFRLNWRLKQYIGKEINVLFSVNNLFDARFAANGWTYRFTSAAYNPVPDDPYAQAEGQGAYNLSGFFPQAGRNWMLSLLLKF